MAGRVFTPGARGASRPTAPRAAQGRGRAAGGRERVSAYRSPTPARGAAGVSSSWRPAPNILSPNCPFIAGQCPAASDHSPNHTTAANGCIFSFLFFHPHVLKQFIINFSLSNFIFQNFIFQIFKHSHFIIPISSRVILQKNIQGRLVGCWREQLIGWTFEFINKVVNS